MGYFEPRPTKALLRANHTTSEFIQHCYIAQSRDHLFFVMVCSVAVVGRHAVAITVRYYIDIPQVSFCRTAYFGNSRNVCK